MLTPLFRIFPLCPLSQTGQNLLPANCKHVRCSLRPSVRQTAIKCPIDGPSGLNKMQPREGAGCLLARLATRIGGKAARNERFDLKGL